MGCRTLSASCTTLPLAGTVCPLTWARMSPICLTLSSIWGWKLHHQTTTEQHKNRPWNSAAETVTALLDSTQVSNTRPPDSENAAEVVHDAVEFVLQLLEEVAGLHVELEEDKTGWIQEPRRVWPITTITACMDTHVFSSHGLEHLLQLNSELLDVIDDDTRLRGDREKIITRTLLSPFPLSAPSVLL